MVCGNVELAREAERCFHGEAGWSLRVKPNLVLLVEQIHRLISLMSKVAQDSGWWSQMGKQCIGRQMWKYL